MAERQRRNAFVKQLFNLNQTGVAGEKINCAAYCLHLLIVTFG
jgi:hypothetical protein